MPSQQFAIRAVTELSGFQQCVDIQGAVWGYEDNDIVPRRMFLVAERIGGQVIGAFDEGVAGDFMVGFAMALPAYRNGQVYLHSHMLAVLPEYRNAGLGRRLKLAQREDAIARGIERMEWTYDPLETKNAYLNLHKLGAISRRYQADFYGPSSSVLQGGLPTDRLYAEWWLRSERVQAALRGEHLPLEAVERVFVPSAVAAWKQSTEERGKAGELQRRNRIQLENAFSRNLAAIGYERDIADNGIFILGEIEAPY